MEITRILEYLQELWLIHGIWNLTLIYGFNYKLSLGWCFDSKGQQYIRFSIIFEEIENFIEDF